MDARQRREVTVERGAQRRVERVDRAVALADGDPSVAPDPDLDRGLVGELDAGARCDDPLAVVRRDPIRLDAEVVVHPASGRTHQQFERGIGRLEHVALCLHVVDPFGQRRRRRPIEGHPELLGLHLHAGPTAEITDQDPGVVADRGGIDVLVGLVPRLAERRGVQPALVGEGRCTHVGVGGMRRQVDQFADVA